MYAIHYFDNKIEVLNIASRIIPAVDDRVRIKGRNGKVISVEKMTETKYFVFVEFEKKVKKSNTNFRKPGMKRK
ncbi:hypothetical protein [Sporosarcina pasteurii]|uniref:Uncharacterized protein n=1 Tax=Sporosarcina pasteurii TaxID=1474 RepID=A0A380BLQ1_SPOPA|nr:hypothetical protein [Sporosarcina pasteurii]MDS9470946.1 hypothetical protein [Sporosarcina pasteurii]QBQ05400.1 hypothetical protein E2C16_06820 [Sporosarcina pasteurii]SUJ03419.1 Uncharacterised protein [Sporosarcina pasteurii]